MTTTKAQLEVAITQAVKRHPGRHNPRTQNRVRVTGYSDPVYTSPDDSNYHCIIGQVAADLGWSVPGSDVILPADEAAPLFGWPLDLETARWLTSVQNQFDSATGNWQDALNHCQEIRLINSAAESRQS